MDASLRTRSLRMVLLLAAAYLFTGIVFAAFSDGARTNAMHLLWRRLAWLVSGVGFAVHILYGHFCLRNPPRATAMHASIAAALGAGGLALAANVHEWTTATTYRASIALSLVAWPLLTIIPAFIAALLAAALLNQWWRHSDGQGSRVVRVRDRR